MRQNPVSHRIEAFWALRVGKQACNELIPESRCNGTPCNLNWPRWEEECRTDDWSKFLSCAQSSLYLSLILKLNHSGLVQDLSIMGSTSFQHENLQFQVFPDFLICKTRKRKLFSFMHNYFHVFTKGTSIIHTNLPFNLISFAKKIG